MIRFEKVYLLKIWVSWERFLPSSKFFLHSLILLFYEFHGKDHKIQANWAVLSLMHGHKNYKADFHLVRGMEFKICQLFWKYILGWIRDLSWNIVRQFASSWWHVYSLVWMQERMTSCQTSFRNVFPLEARLKTMSFIADKSRIFRLLHYPYHVL